MKLEKEDDINKVTDFFSYEHFYVVYCKFWELDTDHDLYISPDDLARHCDHGMKTHNTLLYNTTCTYHSHVLACMHAYLHVLWTCMYSSFRFPALNRRVVERLFSGVVTRDTRVKGQMSYKDFVWFLLSEEDKSTPKRSVSWYSCILR